MPPESRRDAKHYPVAYSQTTWTCLISPLSYRPQETGQHISNMVCGPNSKHVMSKTLTPVCQWPLRTTALILVQFCLVFPSSLVFHRQEPQRRSWVMRLKEWHTAVSRRPGGGVTMQLILLPL